MMFLERVMSTRNPAVVLPPFFSARPLFRSLCASGVDSIRIAFSAVAAWRRRRRERKELYDFLASDHRIAADIGYPHRLP
jgi:uncharacterized protein YjiS (DUF1127 family)